MTETPKPNINNNSITVPSQVPFIGGAKITGAAAILAFMLLGAGYWVYDQVKVRDVFFSRLECKIDLAIWLHQWPKGSVDWSALPVDMYQCVPRFNQPK